MRTGGTGAPGWVLGLPRWHSDKESACQCRPLRRQVRSLGLESPLQKERQPAPVFLPGKFHGQRNLFETRQDNLLPFSLDALFGKQG